MTRGTHCDERANHPADAERQLVHAGDHACRSRYGPCAVGGLALIEV